MVPTTKHDASISGERDFESIAGTWKYACAVAILLGHNLVTVMAMRSGWLWSGAYHLIQFFSPLHFFVFSGYLASAGLQNAARPLARIMLTRGLRVYVLVVAALAWGLAWRLVVKRVAGADSLGSIWPLGVWDGPVDFRQVLLHLSPVGFADHVQFNYATWYLYQELRIVLLFPVFRWILGRSSSLGRWSWAAILMVSAALLEYRFWSYFPMFRSSPFQSLAYGVVFLCGALLWMELRQGGWLSRFSRTTSAILLVAGVGVSFFESMGIRLHLSNPPAQMLAVLAGQILVVTGLFGLVGNFPVSAWLRRACDRSVGIYIVHPPVHVLAAWIAVTRNTCWPLLIGVVASYFGGGLFHRFVEIPSMGWVKRLVDRTG